MIEQLKFSISLSRDQFKSLLAIRDWEGKHWTIPPNNEIKEIKKAIKKQLHINQKKCAYCGILFKGNGDKQIEHIAPKSDAQPLRHPEFTFTLKNLVLACPSCNGSVNKGTKETISHKHPRYIRCKFKIVHPYFDDPNDHYDWVDNRSTIIIQHKNNSTKGKASIEMFELNSQGMTELRAAQKFLEREKRKFPLTKKLENLLNKILSKY